MIEVIPSDTTRWILACLAAALIATAGKRAGALTLSGALAAVLIGTTLVGAGGWWTGILIVVFFVSSSALGQLRREIQPKVQAAKGERRDATQVFANGGIPTTLAVTADLSTDAPPWLVATAAAIAVASADTWATEIGRSSMHTPRMITTGRPAPSGSSGAISLRGTLGAFAGAAAIGLTATVGIVAGWWLPDRPAVPVMVAVTVAGFSGSLVDSVLGATVQAQYRCRRCDMATEQPVHQCGARTERQRGLPFVTNDVVNAAAVSTGAVAVLGWLWVW